MVSVIIIPLAAALRAVMTDSPNGDDINVIRGLMTDAYGDEKHMGTIGRPYP